MSEKIAPGTLCSVCGDLATGNHYNVPSCNGCKTFFRRAVVNNRFFTCMGNGNCPVNKGVRCACRHCRFQKCLDVGMSKSSIQNDRDRIGYTKRTRKSEKNHDNDVGRESHTPDGYENDNDRLSPFGVKDVKSDYVGNFVDPMLERLTNLENNFTLLLSRGEITPYGSLDDALSAPSRFHQPINISLSDPIAVPRRGEDEMKMPFWRSRIIALYIDWAKTFACFRNLPHSDKIALITNHASSYMIMCEAFRTPEHIDESKIENCLSVIPSEESSQHVAGLIKIKTEPISGETSEPMIRLPTEYGSLPHDYGSWIPQDYGRPIAGTEGRSEMHTFFDPKLLYDGKNGDRGVRSIVDVPPSAHYPSVGCLSGLTPVMSAMIDYVMKPFRQLNISTTEFATLQAIMFFDSDTEGIDSASQRNVAAEQKKLLTALHRHISRAYGQDSANERYASILLRIPTIRKVAAKKNESLQMIDMLNLFALNSLVRETALGIRPSSTPAPMPKQSSSQNVEKYDDCKDEYPAE